jgi:hypothetical protein
MLSAHRTAATTGPVDFLVHLLPSAVTSPHQGALQQPSHARWWHRNLGPAEHTKDCLSASFAATLQSASRCRDASLGQGQTRRIATTVTLMWGDDQPDVPRQRHLRRVQSFTPITQ